MPTNQWYEIYPNDYQQNSLHFKFKVLEQDTSSKNVIKLSNGHFPDKIFTAFVNSVKLEQPSPPKQLFTNNNQQPSVPRPILAEDDDVKDHEPIRDGAT